MKTALNRFFSLLLALTMVLSMVPAAALAAETEEPIPEIIEIPTEIPAEEPAIVESEVPETEAPETEEIIVPEEILTVTDPVTYHYEDYMELNMQLPGVNWEADQLPEDDDYYFDDYAIVPKQILCVRNYIVASDHNGRIMDVLPGNYVIPAGQHLAAVMEFEGVNDNGVLTVFDKHTRVVINGTVCPTELLDEGTRIRVSYHYRPQYIDVSNVCLNIPAPVAGEEAVFEAEYAFPAGGRYEIGAHEDVSAHNGIRWIDANSGKAMNPGEKFKSGHYYKALIYIKSGTGCRFSENMTATVNGASDVYVSTYANTETYVQYDAQKYRVVVAEFNLEGEYAIYIEDGKACDAEGNVILFAKPGDVVTLVAGEPTEENLSFEAWEVVSYYEPYIFAEGDDYKNPTTFIMPQGDVHIQCCFWYTNVEEVNLTLEGYGIGSYVDCLTVTEDDTGIVLSENGRYYANYAIYDGPKGTPNSMLPAGTVIEEGETYWLVVNLKPDTGFILDNLYFEYPENIKLNGVAADNVSINSDGSLDAAFLLAAPAALPTGRIAVENGYTYLSDSSRIAQEAPAGARVWLCASMPDELAETHWFSHWEILKGDVDFDLNEPNPGFVMPEGDVELKAVYLPVIRNVNVTMDLPEMGEAPTYAAKSLTEGVSIGEITWYAMSGDSEVPMAEGARIDYEQSYRVKIELIVDDEFTFGENVEGEFNGEFYGAYRNNDNRWFLEYNYETGSRKYSITVENGYAKYFSTEVITAAAAGEAILVEAIIPEGCDFDHWEVVKGDVTILEPDREEFEFKMPAEDVAFKAVLTDLKEVPIMIVDGNGGDLNAAYDISLHSSIDMLVRKGNAMYPEEITWTTSSAATATVEQPEGKSYWNLVFHKPGTVTVTAKDAYGCKDSITITGYYADTAQKFTVTSDVPSIGLQVGERAQMNIFGTDTEIPLSPIAFDYTVSKENIVEVHEGWISGIAPGTVTITAKLRDDPANRKVTLKVTVIEAQVDNINLSYTFVNCSPTYEVVYGQVNENTNYTILYLDSSDFATAQGDITLTPRMLDRQGNELKTTKSSLKWSSSNTKAAKIKANADGSATITVPKGANGMTRITALSNDKAKTEQIFVLHVRDYAPKLEESKFTLDWWKEADAAPLNLTESYGNAIVSAAVFEYNQKAKDYTVPSKNFGVSKDADGNFKLVFGEHATIEKGTVKASLNVTCADGKTYKFLISITVQNKQPKVTLVQFEKLDTTYRDSQVNLGQTAPTSGEYLQIESLKVVGDNKTITALPDTMALVFTEAFKNGEIAKVDPNVVLEVKCVGYKPFEMKFKVATKTSYIYTVIDPGTLTVTAANSSKTVDFKLLDRDTRENLSGYLDHVFIEKSAYLGLQSNNNGTPDDKTDDYLTAVFSEAVPNKTATYSISLAAKKDNWRENHGNVYKIKYIPGVPTVTLDKKTLTLNTTFTEREAQAVLSLSDTGMNIRDLDFEMKCVDKGGSKAWETASKLSVECVNGIITAKFKDTDDIPEPAKCKFEGIPEIEGMKLPKVTVTVDVKAETGKVTLTSGTAKLNKYLAGSEVVSLNCFASNGLQLIGFKENGNEFVDISYSDNYLQVKLKRSDAAARYTFELTPKVKDPTTGQIVYFAKKVKLTVQTYTSDKIGVQVSYSGKLDTLNPESVVTAFVSKVSNAAAGHQILKDMTGADANLFTYSEDADGQIILRLKQGNTYSTKKTYEVAFVYDVFGELVTSNPVSIKISQSKYKSAITPATSLVSLASRNTTTLSYRISLTGADGATLNADSIQVNTAKTPLALRRAIGANPEVTVSADGKYATVAVTFKHRSYLDSGKKYTLAFDVMPAGNASDVKAQIVTATILAK